MQVRRIFDGLVNVVANLGTARDKASHTGYAIDQLSAVDLLSMYRSSWLAGAVVDYPAEDATRKWRLWRAESDQITRIESIEKSIALKSSVQQALICARLYGGSAIYVNTGAPDPSLPLSESEEVRSLVVLARHELTADQVSRDIRSEYFGKPEYYQISSGASAVKIHASRFAVFQGNLIPGASLTAIDPAWGDSVLQKTLDSLKQMDATMANVASLVFEAKVDVFKFEGFAQLLSEGADDLLIRRLNTQAAMKGINGAVALDSKDSYEHKSASFSGLPEVMLKFMEAVSGAAKIPMTRLYGRSAAGLSGTGDGDERVYYDRAADIQTQDIGPAIALLDELIIRQALGSRPPEIYYEWAPLRQMTETERADNFSKTASAARAIAGTAAGPIIPLDALSDALVNELTEQGVLPGLDQAIKQYGTLAEQDGFVGGDDDESQERVTDAVPMPLYVHRPVINADEILAHYGGQGIEGLAQAGQLHVTITYSRQPVDWMRMGEPWASELTIPAGGARLMEVFGPDGDTLVLSFVSSNLAWRHEDMVRNGAMWDWPEYQPHITIAYGFAGDVSSVEPWTGEIVLGPELFEPIDENWPERVKT